MTTSYEIIQLNSFERDIKRIKKRNKPLDKLKQVVEMLAYDQPLPPRCRDHSLIGNWQGKRECHIQPDWLLIYEKTETELILIRTGSHSDLFQ